jgi:type IX secretion system PorP/SprF family membrane protein
MRFRYLIIVLFLTICRGISFAQDAHFSQYYASGLYLNPSVAGIEPGLAFTSNYRTQWRSIVVPYITSQISLIAPIFAKKNMNDIHVGGLGLSVYNDKAGEGNFKTLGVNISGAYNLHLSSTHTITLGVQGGFIQKSIDFTDLQWGEQFNPYIGFDNTVSPSETTIGVRKLYPDVGAGFMYYFNPSSEENGFSAFLGGAAYHINRPNESLINDLVSRLPILFKVHGGFEVPVSEKMSLSPNVLSMMQNNVFHVNSGLYLNYRMNEGGKLIRPSEIVFGAWYRLQDSFIFSMGLGNKNYLLGFSYDFNSSSLRYNTQGRGAYEISLSIRKIKERTIKRFHTPRI